MAELREATERLQAALVRLEQAVERNEPARQAGELRAALRTAQHETAQLQDAARSVADRLDGTIAQLKNNL